MNQSRVNLQTNVRLYGCIEECSSSCSSSFSITEYSSYQTNPKSSSFSQYVNKLKLLDIEEWKRTSLIIISLL